MGEVAVAKVNYRWGLGSSEGDGNEDGEGGKSFYGGRGCKFFIISFVWLCITALSFQMWLEI
jgi:hypothetical protein